MTPQQHKEIKAAMLEALREADTLTREDVKIAAKEVFAEVMGLPADRLDEIAVNNRYVSEWRRTTDTIKDRGLVALVGLFVAGIVGLIVVGVREWLMTPPR